MKLKTILFVLLNLLMVIAMGVFTYNQHLFSGNMSLSVYFGESHAGMEDEAQLFYALSNENFTGDRVVTERITDDVVTFSLDGIDMSDSILRFDPMNREGKFTITGVELVQGDEVLFSLKGKKFKSYIDDFSGISKKWEDGMLICEAKNADPMIYLTNQFCNKIYTYQYKHIRNMYIVLFVIYGLIAIAEIICLAGGEMKKRTAVIASVFSGLSLALGFVIFYACRYLRQQFGLVPFGQLLYHLHTPLDGTDMSSYQDVIWKGIGLTALSIVVFIICYFLLKRKQAQKGYMLWVAFFGMVLIAHSGVKAFKQFDIIEYYQYVNQKTELYDEYYVDGRNVEITFPEKKRNLIYIFLESMEVTYADTASGGAMKENYIPELTELALEHNCFSEGAVLNGPYRVNGATFTMGALVAQTCGVPINETLVSNDTLNGTWESENNYLPGVWSIGDVLAEQSYNQELLIGSVGGFAGRSSYFKGHGAYEVEDYNAAIEAGRIPSDYKVWWGYEDKKLFDYAKEDILKLADRDEPFNFTLLTADTHPVGGYVCDLCENEYESQYTNVIACSNRQTAEFIDWIQEQDFYENTTVVIVGDHLTVDSVYVASENIASFDRRMYFTIMNPAEGKEKKDVKRVYTSMDVYPTTLSAMGVSIEGNRLGLGVDLYSDTATIVEEKGIDYLNTELLKNSDFYTKELLYK